MKERQEWRPGEARLGKGGEDIGEASWQAHPASREWGGGPFSPGPGKWGRREDQTRLLQASRAEHANSRTAVCRGSMHVVRWVRCETMALCLRHVHDPEVEA